MKDCAISYCHVCGDFLFDGLHQGNVEQWCRAINETENPNGVETKILDSAETENRISVSSPSETKNPSSSGETKIRKRGRPRRETENPWTVAGLSRATWYRRMKGSGVA